MKKVLLGSAIFLLLPLAAQARTLTFGMSGSDVTTLQQELVSQGYLSATPNGIFGPATLAAVKKFQCAQSIVCAGSAYGMAGPQTQAALAAAAKVPVQPSAITGAMTASATGKFEISGWVPDWRAASGTLDVAPHLSTMSSVMPFGYHVNSNGDLVDTDHISQDPWPAFIAQAKAAGVRVVPTVEWGSGTTEQAILSNTSARVSLENQIANLVKQNGYDGIDIDFEAKQAGTINYFSTFLKGLYQRMGSKWVYCTVEARMPLEDRYAPGQAVPPDATDYANDYAAINKYCDRVELMAYDQGAVDVRLDAARVAPYAPVADPGWVEDIATLAAQSISRNKLVLGVPTYGYEYSVTPQGAGQYEYNRLWAFNPNYGVQLAAQMGIAPARNSAGELGFAYNPNTNQAAGPAFANIPPQNGNSTQTQQSTPTTTTVQNSGTQVTTTAPFNYVTWSDAQAIADKVALAHKLGLRGVAVFSLGGAEDQNMWNILK